MDLEKQFIHYIQENKGLVNKLVYLYADQKEDRQDLYQEILCQAWKSFKNFKGKAKFSTWLYRVALNVALTALDKRKKRSQGVESKASGSYQSGYEAKDLMDQTLKQFNEIDRTILVLQTEGYPQEEIADIIGISHGNLRTRLHRIRKKIGVLWQS